MGKLAITAFMWLAAGAAGPSPSPRLPAARSAAPEEAVNLSGAGAAASAQSGSGLPVGSSVATSTSVSGSPVAPFAIPPATNRNSSEIEWDLVRESGSLFDQN